MPLVGRIGGMQIRSKNGKDVSMCTQKDGSQVVSTHKPNAAAGMPMMIMMKKAGPSAGSANE